ncbi:MAG: rRNA small subunit methyltransferase [Acidimicrobiales bacterium]|nr:rRNA small subunit methyltransferase [Acidimicrobiales bacterium]
MLRRCRFLREAVDGLGLADRVAVVQERAELVGRDPEHRGRADVVVARSFGPPAVAAECAGPLLAVGGDLVMSEPPTTDDAQRWPPAALAELGFGGAERVEAAYHVVRVPLLSPTGDRWPRRVGIPAKRPLF